MGSNTSLLTAVRNVNIEIISPLKQSALEPVRCWTVRNNNTRACIVRYRKSHEFIQNDRLATSWIPSELAYPYLFSSPLSPPEWTSLSLSLSFSPLPTPLHKFNPKCGVLFCSCVFAYLPRIILKITALLYYVTKLCIIAKCWIYS